MAERRALDRLDSLSPWAFTGSLYLARWLIILPVAFAGQWLGAAKGGARFDAPVMTLLFGFLVLAPLFETVLECAAPYWLMRKAGLVAAGRRPWGFVVVSALLMALLHLDAWPAALLPSLVTGGFLAYTYGHFAPQGGGTALGHTAVFHAGINIIGWLLIVFSR
jgi:hypothetical protein